MFGHTDAILPRVQRFWIHGPTNIVACTRHSSSNLLVLLNPQRSSSVEYSCLFLDILYGARESSRVTAFRFGSPMDVIPLPLPSSLFLIHTRCSRTRFEKRFVVVTSSIVNCRCGRVGLLVHRPDFGRVCPGL